MTTDNFIKSLDAKIAEVIKFNKPLLSAVKTITAMQSNRVFIKGLNAENSVIGEYSNNEIYVSNNKSVTPKAVTPIGKYGEKKFANGKPHKSAYFINYLAYKKKIGRNKFVNSVDLNLFGELQQDWANSKVLKSASARKRNQHNYYISLKTKNYNKVQRYGNVFGLSKEEKEMFYKVLNFELQKALK